MPTFSLIYQVFSDMENRYYGGSQRRQYRAKLIVDRGEPQKDKKRRCEMEWLAILILVIGIPVILFPAAYVWYLTGGGIVAAIREKRKAGRGAEVHVVTK